MVPSGAVHFDKRGAHSSPLCLRSAGLRREEARYTAAPHASAPNLSDRPRRALILTYNPVSAGKVYEERYGIRSRRRTAGL
jgi:hypothetical protein